MQRRHTTGTHTPSRTKPTLNIDHRGPVDDTDAGVGRSAASMASIIVQLLEAGLPVRQQLRRKLIFYRYSTKSHFLVHFWIDLDE